MWWKKPFINWDAHPRRVDHNQSQTITNGQKLVGSLPCSDSYTLLCCKVWRSLNRCRHSQAELKKIVEQDTFASIREAPGKCGFPNSRNTKCRRDKHHQPLFGVMWLSHFVWGFFSRIYTFGIWVIWLNLHGLGGRFRAHGTGGDDGLERANPDDARSIGLAVQNSRAGKSWWQGETDTERLKRLWCCVVFFLVPGSFCSEWRARWRELLDIHILYSMGNKELLRVTRFVSYSL